MSVYAVGDTQTLDLFELAGIPGRITTEEESLADILTELSATAGAEIVFVQAGLVSSLSETQLDELTRNLGCLVVQVPGIGESIPDATDFGRHLRAAMGGAI